MKPCTTGVPQGSILEPLLFSVYINNLPAVCKDTDIIMYVDDAVIYVHRKGYGASGLKIDRSTVIESSPCLGPVSLKS